MESPNLKREQRARLTPEQHKAIKKYRKQFLTKEACRRALGINIKTLNSLLNKETVSPVTIEKIFLKIAA